MLTRRKICWVSIVKSKTWFLATAISILCGSAHAQFILVDDFEGHAVDAPVEGVVGPGATWTGDGVGRHTAAVDPADATNQAMKASGTPGGAVLRAELAPADFIAFGDTGTLFYRFRTTVTIDNGGGGVDHVVGLTDNNAITNFNFKSGLRNINTAAVPSNRFDLRDAVSPGYEEVAQLADNTWYKLWMVSTNTNPGTFVCYLQSDTDPNFATQTLLASDSSLFNYRINGDTDIVNVYFRNANNDLGVDGFDLFFDDVYINSSASDLSDPTAVVSAPAGDFNGDGVVDCADLDGYVGNIGAAATGALAALDIDGSGFLEASDANTHITTLIVTQPNGVTGTFVGDVNCDGEVNVLGDAFALVASLGGSATMYSQGDLNFDGQVNVLGDAFALVANLGMSNQ